MPTLQVLLASTAVQTIFVLNQNDRDQFPCGSLYGLSGLPVTCRPAGRGVGSSPVAGRPAHRLPAATRRQAQGPRALPRTPSRPVPPARSRRADRLPLGAQRASGRWQSQACLPSVRTTQNGGIHP